MEMTYAHMEPAKYEMVACAGPVRFNQTIGLLEQLWVVTEYTGGSPSGKREEWRTIPSVAP